jgi:hypothetical protein
VEVRKFLSETDISVLGAIDLKYDKYLTFSHQNKEIMGIIKTVESNKSENLIVYEKLIDKYNTKIYQKLKNKEFYKAIISMFNVDLIMRKVRFNMEIEFDSQRKFDNLETNWRNKLDLYPASVKRHLKGLYEFLNFDLLYKFYHDATNEFTNIEKNYLINTNNYRSNDRSLQVLRFFILNEIMIDEYSIFSDLMKIYVELKFRLMIKNNKSDTNVYQFPLSNTQSIEEHDLFILVKYFKFKKLYELIHSILEYYESSGSYIDCAEHTQYLLTTFENLVSLYDGSRTGIFSDTIGKAITNLILVNSLIEWKSEDLDRLVKLISLSFINENLPSDAYKALNKFIYYNFKLFNISSEKTKNLLDIPLRNILSRGLNALEFHSVSNDLGNLFGILAETDIKYENDILISQVIGSLKPIEDVSYQRKISKNILVKYLYIVNKKTVNKIHKYINSIRLKDWSKSVSNELLFEELTFNMFGLKVNNNFINFLSSNIENYKRVTEEVGPRTREQQENLSRILDIPILFEFIRALSDKSIPEYIELQKKLPS